MLIQDAILYTYSDEPKKLHLDRDILKEEIVEKNGKKSYTLRNKSWYSFHTIVPKGTILTINRITIEAGFDGSERCIQNIYATFLFDTKETSANISYLFKNRFNSPKEKWNFLSKSDVIAEIFNDAEISTSANLNNGF